MRCMTMIPNEVMDVYLRELKLGELKVLLVVLRQTLGYQAKPGSPYRKARDWIAISRMQELTGCDRKTIAKAIQRLIALETILVTDRAGNVLGTPNQRKFASKLYFSQNLRPVDMLGKPWGYWGDI